MPAYVIVDIDVSDPVRYEDYKHMAHDTVLAYDGRYVVRGGPAERLEGSWRPHRIVVLEFPSVERAEIARSEMILVEGV